MSPSDGSALDVWHTLPPHLREELREAMEGLSEAFGDLSQPVGGHLNRIEEITNEIEALQLARHHEHE